MSKCAYVIILSLFYILFGTNKFSRVEMWKLIHYLPLLKPDWVMESKCCWIKCAHKSKNCGKMPPDFFTLQCKNSCVSPAMTNRFMYVCETQNDRLPEQSIEHLCDVSIWHMVSMFISCYFILFHFIIFIHIIILYKFIFKPYLNCDCCCLPYTPCSFFSSILCQIDNDNFLKQALIFSY